MRVAIFNVKYSPNLGDGVIAECLEHALRQRAAWSAWSIDLAGRERWSRAGDGRGRALKLTVLSRMPGPVRNGVAGVALGFKVRKRLMKHWRELLKGADAAIFGGGQLIQDTDLNFPVKLAGAAAACRSRGIPMAVFAVGAARCRSLIARLLLGRLLRSPLLFFAAARDGASCGLLRELGAEAQLCSDPGLLACSVWPAQIHERGARPVIGLGITHGAILEHHGSWRAHRLNDALSLYVSMAKRLRAANFDVVCFTNGAAEDELLAGEVALHFRQEPAAGDGRSTVRVAPRCETPGQLARLIAGFNCVVGHRLHASILAYSYRIPSVGLRWDDKLVHFYQSVGRADLVMPFDWSTADAIADTVRQSMLRPIDEASHAGVLAETRAGIDRLIAAIVINTGGARERPQLIGATLVASPVPREAFEANSADARLKLANGDES